MDYEFQVDGKTRKLSIKEDEGKVVAVVDGNRLEIDVRRISPNLISMLADGHSCLAHVARQGEKILVAIGGRHFCFEEPSQDSAIAGMKASSAGRTEETVKSPMPGMVIKILVAEGDHVSPGDSLVVVEAMKMEHDLRAAFPAVVEKVHVKAGQQVDALQSLVELKPAADSDNPS